MAKRQIRIHALNTITDKKSLVGEVASFCITDNRVIFGTIIDFKNDKFTLRDKLLKNHTFSVKEIAELIIEKTDNISIGDVL